MSVNSIRTSVKINKDSTFGKNCNIKKLNNKEIKNQFTKKKFETPYMHNYWQTTFNREINWQSLYFTINNVLVDNRIKALKIKLIHKIVPTNENLFKWKLIDSPLCKLCSEVETLEHFFISCVYIKSFWDEMLKLFTKLNINQKFGMFEIIVGYKTRSREYRDVNIILCQIIYTLYKSYMKSERRIKQINMFKILYYDLMTLDKYFDSKKENHAFISKFIKALTEIV